MADFVDADAAESVQGLGVAAGIVNDAFDDGTDGGPSDAHEFADGGLGAVGSQPGDLIVEGVGVAGIVAGPGDGRDDDAMDGALDAGGVCLDEGPHGAQIKATPTAAAMSVIVQRAAAATEAATAGSAAVRADVDDDGIRIAIEADALDEGAVDTEQMAPQVSSTYEPVIPFSPEVPSYSKAQGQRYDKPAGNAGLKFCYQKKGAVVQPPANTTGEVRSRSDPSRTVPRQGILPNLDPHRSPMGPGRSCTPASAGTPTTRHPRWTAQAAGCESSRARPSPRPR